MSQSRSSSILDVIDGHLDKIQGAFFRAFDVDGLGPLFQDYWLIISPRHFMLDDADLIDQYYDKQIARIPSYLKACDSHTIAEEKQRVLKTISELCHKLARLKFAITKLLLLSHPDVFSSACRDLHQNMATDLHLDQADNRYIRQEIDILEHYFYLLGVRLTSLGYMHAEYIIGKHVRDGAALPQLLQSNLVKLQNNTQLEVVIDKLRAASTDKKKKNKYDKYKGGLNKAIDDIAQVKLAVEQTMDHVLVRYEQSSIRVKNTLQQLTDILNKSQRQAFVLKFVPDLTQFADEWYRLDVKTAIKSTINACTSNRSRVSIAARGMISDPWAETEKVLAELCQLEGRLKVFVASYSGEGISMLMLQRQHQALTQRSHDLNRLYHAMCPKLHDAQQARTAYLRALDKTSLILKGHIDECEGDTVLGFGRRHWGKMLSGGTSGALLATVSLLLTANPLLLAVVIVAGATVGTAGGAGGGLVQDSMVEKSKEKEEKKIIGNATDNTNVSGYGSFWRRKATLAVTQEPVMARVTKP